MKRQSTPPVRLLCSAAFLMAFFSTSAQAQKQWAKETVNDTFSWSDSANWTGGTPNATENEAVYITVKTGAKYTINLDTGADQILQGGFFLSSHSTNPGSISLNLQTRQLIIDGGAFALNADSTGADASTRWTISNGTVQIGTLENAASWILGTDTMAGSTTASNNYQPFSALFTSDTVVNTANMSNLEISANPGSRSKNFVLDLSAATIRSGSEAGVFSLAGSIKIGLSDTQTPNANSIRVGALKLGQVHTVSIGEDLILGQGQRPTPPGNSNVSIPKQGTLEFSAVQSTPVSLNIGRDVRLGVGDRAIGTITNRPAVLNVTIGDAATEASNRGVIYIGYKNESQGREESTRDGDTSGDFSGGTTGGSLDAWVRELRVGQNTQTAGSATGVLDFRHSTLGSLSITNEAVIGNGVNAAGSVYLKSGTASSSTLLIGDATGSIRSLLSLDSTSWSVSDTLLVGSLGDLNLNVTSGIINLDLSSGADGAFTIKDGGVIRATFDSAIDGQLWAIRQAGDQQDAFAALIAQEKLIALGTYGAQAGVYFDGSYTYYGMIPEPASTLLLGSAGAVILLYRRANKSRSASTKPVG